MIEYLILLCYVMVVSSTYVLSFTSVCDVGVSNVYNFVLNNVED